MGSIPGLTQWVEDPALLGLGCRLVAEAPIRPLAWEHPYAVGMTLKRHTHTHTQKGAGHINDALLTTWALAGHEYLKGRAALGRAEKTDRAQPGGLVSNLVGKPQLSFLLRRQDSLRPL